MLVIPVRVVASHANMHSDHEVFRKQRQKGIQKSVEKGRWLQEGPKTDGVPRTPRQTTGSFIQSVHEGEKTDSSGNETNEGNGGADHGGRWVGICKKHVVRQPRDSGGDVNIDQRNRTVRHVDHVTVSIQLCG